MPTQKPKTKKLWIALLTLSISVFVQDVFAEYRAYCVKFSGDRFVDVNIFKKDDKYFRISDDEYIFIAESKTQDGLASLSPKGRLVSVSGFNKFWVSEQITPNQYVRQGYYLKNPIMYQRQQEYDLLGSPAQENKKASLFTCPCLVCTYRLNSVSPEFTHLKKLNIP